MVSIILWENLFSFVHFFYALDLQKVQLIIDTDASFAVDDVVAICLAHSLANKGNWNIKDQSLSKESWKKKFTTFF